MANEINIVIAETGLTLVAKLWQGNTQIGSNITMTENSNRTGHYYGDAPVSIADGIYVLIIETNTATIKGSSEVQFIDNILQTGNLTKLDELHKIAGLNADAPMSATSTTREAGDIELDISGYGGPATTVQRV
jgi:hypothetical protein